MPKRRRIGQKHLPAKQFHARCIQCNHVLYLRKATVCFFSPFRLKLSVPVIIFLSLVPKAHAAAAANLPPLRYASLHPSAYQYIQYDHRSNEFHITSPAQHQLNAIYIFICIWHNNSICLRRIYSTYMVLAARLLCALNISLGVMRACVCVCMHQCRAITFF